MARTSGLASITIGQLAAELARRQKALPRLLKKKGKLEKQLAAIDGQIADLSGEVAPAKAVVKKTRRLAAKKKAGSRKPPRPGSLKALLVAALAGKEGVSVGEAMEAVQTAGYKSQSRNFRLLINQTLLNEPEFKKVGRGVFTVKGKSGRKPAVKAEAPAPERKAEKGAPTAARKPKARHGARGKYPETAEQFVLDLAKGKGAAGGDINKAWTASGRKGSADSTLSLLVKGGKLKREKVLGRKGSRYTLA